MSDSITDKHIVNQGPAKSLPYDIKSATSIFEHSKGLLGKT